MSTITIIGIGGAGSNIINHISTFFPADSIKFVAVNTDAQHLNLISSNKKITTIKVGDGLGAGMNPQTAIDKLTVENKKSISESISGSDLVILTAGLGGGTGTGLAPQIVELAEDQSIPTIAISTLPFAFEGRAKTELSQEYLELLKGYKKLNYNFVSNQKLLQTSQKLSISQSFQVSNETVRRTVETITNIINNSGILNIDFEDVKSVLTGGRLVVSSGTGATLQEAIKNALNNPLLESTRIQNFTGLLLNIVGRDVDLNSIESEIDNLSQLTTGATIKFGYSESQSDLITVELMISGLDRAVETQSVTSYFSSTFDCQKQSLADFKTRMISERNTANAKKSRVL
jgi:cell division protein FtsZ